MTYSKAKAEIARWYRYWLGWRNRGEPVPFTEPLETRIQRAGPGEFVEVNPEELRQIKRHNYWAEHLGITPIDEEKVKSNDPG